MGSVFFEGSFYFKESLGYAILVYMSYGQMLHVGVIY